MNLKGGSLHELCIGLTGGVACGKSTIGKFLKELGYLVVDADVLSREAMEINTPAYLEIVATFGSSILNEDLSLNRRALREIVFADYQKLDTLEKIVTPQIQKLLLNVAAKQESIWFYEAAILLKFYKPTDFKQVWYATCPEPIQIQRLISRDNITETLAKQMIHRQSFDNKECYLVDTYQSISEVKKYILSLLETVGEGLL